MEYFDLDGDGKIDQYEFTCALALLAEGTINEKTEFIFRLYDFNKSESLSKDELTILMTNVMTGIAKVSKSPIPKIAQIEKKSEAIFRTCDIDGNGEI